MKVNDVKGIMEKILIVELIGTFRDDFFNTIPGNQEFKLLLSGLKTDFFYKIPG